MITTQPKRLRRCFFSEASGICRKIAFWRSAMEGVPTHHLLYLMTATYCASTFFIAAKNSGCGTFWPMIHMAKCSAAISSG